VLDGSDGVNEPTLAACFAGTAANPGCGLSWWILRPDLVPPSPHASLETTQLHGLLDEEIVMAAGAGHQRLYPLRRRGWVVVRQASGILGAMLGRGADWDDGESPRVLLQSA
jgi:hypothetical protein